MDHTLIIFMISFISLMALVVFGFAKYQQYSRNKEITKQHQIFNQSRNIPIPLSIFEFIYNYNHDWPVLFLTGGRCGEGNQRDGDELMFNPNRNPKDIISDHFDLPSARQGTCRIVSLGYNFTRKQFLQDFVETFLEIMPSGIWVIPINQTWAVFVKSETGKTACSLDQTIFTRNDIRKLTLQ